MAIKATKQGEDTRWLLSGYYTTHADFEKAIETHQAEGWTMTYAEDYADTMAGNGNLTR